MILWLVLVFQFGSLSANDKTDFNKEAATFTEYVDDEYGYAFHYPSDWVMQKTPEGNEIGEVRVLLLSARGTITVTVGHFGNSVTREQLNDSPYRDAFVEQVIDLTIEQVYRKSSRKLKASNMVITEKRTLPSDTGILFYIKTTFSTNEGIPMSVSGIHAMPFGKDYIIGFLMITGLKKENETLRSAFNSFHLIGEQPIVAWEADTQ